MIANVQRQLAVVVAAGITAGCNNLPSVNPITTAVDPNVLTYARIQGRPDPDNLCSPASPPAPTVPSQWWNSLPPAHLPKVAAHGVVGFDLWRNQTGSCRAFRQDVYRTAFSYNLSALQSLKGLVTKAELSFHVAVMPAVRPNSLCQAMTGGGGSLLMVRPPFAPPQSSFVDLGSDLGSSAPPGANTAQPFPAGVTVFGMTFPWLAGQVANGVTTSDGGGQRASFTVDVTDRLNGAFNRGDAVIAFMLSGSDETLPTVAPPDRFDCRTVYRIGQLVIKHL